MTYRSHTTAPSRVFDHLYDPLFTTSDRKNVYKEDCIALMRSAPIQVYPVFNSMFSEMCYEERNCYAYQKNALPHYPGGTSATRSKKTLFIAGSDRPKFFTNPINNAQTINIGLMVEEKVKIDRDANGRFQTTACVQTVYRYAMKLKFKYLLNNKILDENLNFLSTIIQRVICSNKAFPSGMFHGRNV
jgi:hypothetical protein